MIFKSIYIKNIFDIIIPNKLQPKIIEIINDDENMIIASNFDDLYYIRYTEKIGEEESDNYSGLGEIIIDNDIYNKINKLVNIWPKSKFSIIKEEKSIIIEIIENGSLRETPVNIDCVFDILLDEIYSLCVPEGMKANCLVDSVSIKNMLEFCNDKNYVIIRVLNNGLIINNYNKTIGSKVDIDELYITPKKSIVLKDESINLLCMFLECLCSKYKGLLYLFFLEEEYAFSVKTTPLKSNNLFGDIQIFIEHF